MRNMDYSGKIGLKQNWQTERRQPACCIAHISEYPLDDRSTDKPVPATPLETEQSGTDTLDRKDQEKDGRHVGWGTAEENTVGVKTHPSWPEYQVNLHNSPS